ncbi:MAG: hypothetical protein KKA79_01240, partial [Nanoarchaeota archaeon]|nr:hypothetical protein [Nanoarchaeota archaeon]
MKRIFFCFVFVLLVCSMVFAVSGVECVKNVDCSQSSCEVVSSLCEGGYCVFRAIGPKSCSDFEFPVCGNGFCEESEECKCPEDCQDVKPMIVKAPQIGSPDITINPTSFSDFEADVVFAVVNKDPEHKLEAFLHCKLPGNVEVSQTEGVDYLKGFVVSENFILDSAPGIHSMSFGLRSLDYGVKSIVCNINYVYF